MSENVVRTDVGTLQGDVKVDGTLSVTLTGAATLSSTLDVTGAITSDADGADVSVTGSTTITTSRHCGRTKWRNNNSTSRNSYI